MTSKSRKALAALFQRFSEEVNLLPTDWQKLAAGGDEKHKARVIADYLASMTDRYALLEYERIFETGPILS
jgi:dGTPase